MNDWIDDIFWICILYPLALSGILLGLASAILSWRGAKAPARITSLLTLIVATSTVAFSGLRSYELSDHVKRFIAAVDLTSSNVPEPVLLEQLTPSFFAAWRWGAGAWARAGLVSAGLACGLAWIALSKERDAIGLPRFTGLQKTSFVGLAVSVAFALPPALGLVGVWELPPFCDLRSTPDCLHR